MSIKISLICALTEYGVIGKDSIMPWNIQDEQLYFVQVTSGHPVIMGRKTYESIGHPLEHRETIVISSNKKFIEKTKNHNIKVFNSLVDAIDYCDGRVSECFIIGGRSLFEFALNEDFVDKMYLNFIREPYEGNVFFPEIDKSLWLTEINESTPSDDFKATIWIRKNRDY